MFSLSLWGPQLLLNSLLYSDSSFHFSLVWLCNDPTLYECQSHGSNERLHPREYSGPLFYIVSQKPLSLVIWIPHPVQESNPLAWHIWVYQQEENRTARWQSPLPIHQSYCWFSWQKYSSLGREDLQSSRAQSCKNKTQRFCEWNIRQMNDRKRSFFPFLISRPMYSGYGRNKFVTCKARTNLLCELKAPSIALSLPWL